MATVTQRHEDSQNASHDQSKSCGEDKIAERGRGIVIAGRDMLKLVDAREQRHDPRRDVAAILPASMESEELPGARNGEEDKHRGEQAPEV